MIFAAAHPTSFDGYGLDIESTLLRREEYGEEKRVENFLWKQITKPHQVILVFLSQKKIIHAWHISVDKPLPTPYKVTVRCLLKSNLRASNEWSILKMHTCLIHQHFPGFKNFKPSWILCFIQIWAHACSYSSTQLMYHLKWIPYIYHSIFTFRPCRQLSRKHKKVAAHQCAI